MSDSATKSYQIVPLSQNRDLLESYNFATIRDGVGIFGERLLLRLTEFANKEGYIQGIKMKNYKGGDRPPLKMETNALGYISFNMPLSSLMGTSWEYSRAKDNILACMHYIISSYDRDGNQEFYPFITYAKVEKGNLRVDIRQELWKCLLDFSKGFRKFELNIAFQISSKYALKMYKIVSGQINPITYSIEDLKTVLGAIYFEERKFNGKFQNVKIEKYPRVRDFIKRVINPAKAELDRMSPYTFDYVLLYSKANAKGRGTVSAITFHPIYQPKFRDDNLKTRQIDSKYRESLINYVLTTDEKKMLLHKFAFTEQGIKANFELWSVFERTKIDLIGELDELALQVAKARPNNVQGYVVNALKRILTYKYGVPPDTFTH